ncbi:hypothetical protein [Konateibacter massiliensis]|uniref:hypothetical protein n=1 Tax=Konateibacter massiliensis TaxID=2002841 RepID=UPI0015D4F892|nr:hypothetical protein [Konateibacter massiliensis]
MKIKVEDIGRGTLLDTNGNTYIVDGEEVMDDNGNAYNISDYDEYDNVTEIEKIV